MPSYEQIEDVRCAITYKTEDNAIYNSKGEILGHIDSDCEAHTHELFVCENFKLSAIYECMTPRMKRVYEEAEEGETLEVIIYDTPKDLQSDIPYMTTTCFSIAGCDEIAYILYNERGGVAMEICYFFPEPEEDE